MKHKTTPSFLVCPKCCNVVTIHRKVGKQKELYHIKDLYCYRCQDVTKHIEYKTDYAAYQAVKQLSGCE